MESIVSQFLKDVFKYPAVQTSLDSRFGSSEDVLSTIFSALSLTEEKKSPPKPKKVKKSKPAPSPPPSNTTATPESEDSELDKLTIAMLKDKCKNLGIKPIGNKQSLINKIKEHIKLTQEQKQNSPAEDEIEIVKDAQGLYVHAQTGLVFNPNTRVIVAYKDEDDCVLPLTPEHIELCNQWGFEYHIDED